MIRTFRPRNSCIAFVYSLVGGGITRTFRPWTHTSDDTYIYQLSLVVATATVSYVIPGLYFEKSIIFVSQPLPDTHVRYGISGMHGTL